MQGDRGIAPGFSRAPPEWGLPGEGRPVIIKTDFINYIYFARGMDMESLVLSTQDVENLESMSDGSTVYF